MESSFSAPGIVCDGCAATIARTLGALPGVAEVGVDVEQKAVRVTHGPGVTREELARALADAGYPPSGHPGSLPPIVSIGLPGASASASTETKDPVCGMTVDPASAAGR